MVKGISHITLSVQSLSKSFSFYRDILGFKPLMKTQKSAYFLAGDLWFCIEQDQNARAKELPEYSHIAFSVDQDDFEIISKNKIRTSGVRIFKENESEGESVYFLDPNGHKLELHVGDWKTRLAVYRDRADVDFFD